MAGALNFQLGLQTSQFLSGLGAARGGLGQLIGMGSGVAALAAPFLSVGAVVSKVAQEFARGGQYFDLGKRLSETPGAIFQVGYALDQVGGSAGNAGNLINLLNKSMGGVNEQGEPTAKAFGQLGLSIDDLSKLDAPQKLQAISKAMSGLSQERKTDLASKIFGKGGAQDFLSVANSAEDFAEALRDAAARAAQITRTAASFDRVGDTLKRFKDLSVGGFFGGVAEGLAPGVQLFADKLNKMDLAGLGQRIGNEFTIATEAFSQGTFGELLTLTLKSSFQDGSNFMLSKIAEWSDAVGKAFSDPAGKKMGFFENVGWSVMALPQGLAGFAGSLQQDIGIPMFPWEKMLTDKMLGNFQGWLDYADERGGWFGSKGITDGMKFDGTNPFTAELQRQREQYLADAQKRADGFIGPMQPKPKDLPPSIFSGVGAFGKNVLGTNALERIGANFAGAGSRGMSGVENNTRSTFQAIGKSNQLLERMARKLEATPQNPFIAI